MQLFYLGVDVSKGYADFVILDDRKQHELHSFQLDDTSKGHKHLFEIISHFLKQRPQAVVHAAVESTGGYENNWYHSLLGEIWGRPLNYRFIYDSYYVIGEYATKSPHQRSWSLTSPNRKGH